MLAISYQLSALMIGHIFATPLLERLRKLQVFFNRHDANSAKQRQDLLKE